MGIKANFTRGQVRQALNNQMDRVIFAIIESLKYVGENFITDARISGAYTDRTGNLRSSVGYLIVFNGRITHSAFSDAGVGTDGATGKSEGEQYAISIAKQFKGKRIVFVGVAGMQYAAAVESRGLEVISSSSDRALKSLESQLKTIKNHYSNSK